MSAAPETSPLSPIELNGGAAVVSYDPRKWEDLETDSDGVISLDRVGGVGTAAIIAEQTAVPTAALADGLLEELGKAHPGMKLLCREMRTVNGREICCLKYSCQLNGIDLVLYIYCFGGLAGSFQVRTCAGAAAFDECEADFTELLNSLEIRAAAHPGLVRMRHNARFALRVTVLSLPVIGIGLVRFLIRTGVQTALLLAAGLTLGAFAVGWVYALYKYKLE